MVPELPTAGDALPDSCIETILCTWNVRGLDPYGSWESVGACSLNHIFLASFRYSHRKTSYPELLPLCQLSRRKTRLLHANRPTFLADAASPGTLANSWVQPGSSDPAREIADAIA